MELPARYGHYVLLERIAVGGMGEIFKAKYAGLAGFERPCAIKRILPHLSEEEEFADRLIHEAKVAVQLSHANIVQIFELGKIEHEYFIAMEWIDGPDLSSLLFRAHAKDLPLPRALAIHIVHEVARALDHAHNKADAEGRPLGIVHRDVSPQNVMISIDGAVKLGDFGIARAGGIARQFATNAGAVLGKRRYMSPEQRRGDPVDGRADVYALGAILYELIADEPPDPDTALVPLSSRFSDLPEGLDDLCTLALQYEPEKRLPDAATMVSALERIFMRMASQPGAIRDPSLELGRYVQKVCPPGEKRPQRRSLTARMRDAMRPGVPEANGAPAMPESTANLVARPPEAPMATGEFHARTSTPGAFGAVEAVAEENTATAVGVFHDETATGAVARPELTPAEDSPIPREPPPAARDGAGVTLVISTVMVPMQKASAAETAVGPRAAAATADPGRAAAAEAARAVAAATAAAAEAAASPVPSSAAAAQTVVRPRPSAPPAPEPPLFPDASKSRTRAPLAALAGGAALIIVTAGGWYALSGPRALDASPTPLARPTRALPRHTPTAIAASTHAPATPAPTPHERERERERETPRPHPTRVAVVSTPRPRPSPTPHPVAHALDATLSVGALPWANISVDGKSYGSLSTDVKVTSGEPHVVVFEHPKFGKRVRTVTPKAGETEKVIVDFKNPE